ncbi:hypothetical protein H9P43_005674 [Blastocladiella emersonii ATCC 22665]|nr:hypothetical protein H9P43_005674 [Blastocladiella emersonii ATCC 22665]
MEYASESLHCAAARAPDPLGFGALPSTLIARVLQLAAPHHCVLTASRDLFDGIQSRQVKLAWINTLCELKVPDSVRTLYVDHLNQNVRTNLCGYLELEFIADGKFAELPDRPGLDALVTTHHTTKHGHGRCVRTSDDMMAWTIAANTKVDRAFLDELRRVAGLPLAASDRLVLTELEQKQSILNRMLNLGIERTDAS